MKTNIEYLSPRLIAVRSMVDKERVADIGCDHGKLIEDLFRNGKINYAFVSDISEPSVKKAVNLLTNNNRNFDYAVADGLDKIEEQHNIQQVVISGMGGLEIIKILENNKLNLDNFVLQPQNNEIKLKKWLNENNYEIIKDLIVKDRHIYYNVFKVQAVKKVKRQKFFDMKFGKDNFYGNEDFYKYLQYSKSKFEKMLWAMPKSKQKEVKKELKLIKKAVRKWERINENNVAISKTRYGVEKNSTLN